MAKLNPKLVARNGKVTLWDLGPAEDDPNRKQWEKTLGPHEIEMWAVDAVHALEVEPDRFAAKLPNGTKSGPEQASRERARALETQGHVDPHFGATA
jgi:hypothetical protein